MQKVIIIVLTLLFFPGLTAADFPVSYDLAGFKNLSDSTTTFYEIYLSTNMNDLTPEAVDQKYEIGYEAALDMIQLKSGQHVVNETWKKSITAVDTMEMNRYFVDQITLVLEPGQYAFELQVKDLFSERKTIYPDTLNVPAFTGDELALSNLQISSQIEANADARANFVKNGMMIMPHPTRLFGVHLPLVYFYAEVYNLTLEPGQNGTFQAVYQILDIKGNVVKSLTPQAVNAYGPDAILASAVKVEELAVGTYFLDVTITDLKTGLSANGKDRFHIDKPLAVTGGAAAFIPELNETNEENYYSEVFYHFTFEEREQYKSLTYEGKRAFLIKYWDRHDPLPQTPMNENYVENKRRVKFANDEFGYGNVPGWKTDEGRIFILYGQYDEVEHEESSLQGRPYRIWHYYQMSDMVSLTDTILGRGAYFIFAELSFDGKYTLVHSNVEGEIKNKNFARQINEVPDTPDPSEIIDKYLRDDRIDGMN